MGVPPAPDLTFLTHILLKGHSKYIHISSYGNKSFFFLRSYSNVLCNLLTQKISNVFCVSHKIRNLHSSHRHTWGAAPRGTRGMPKRCEGSRVLLVLGSGKKRRAGESMYERSCQGD